MTAFWIAMQFLTVFPVQLKQIPSPQQNAQSLLFYPLIGMLIGLVLFAIALTLVKLPIILLSTLLLVVWIWITGGLHLDGLADTADAWVGGFGDPEKTLRIMKDPSSGPIGVLSLLIVCVLKWSALYVLLEQQQLWLLILVPMLARLSPLILFLTTPYVRAKGLGTAMSQYIPRKLSYVIVALVFGLCGFMGLWGLLLVIFSTMTLWYLRAKFIRRIGGITGDTIGATIEWVESVALFTMVCLLSLY